MINGYVCASCRVRSHVIESIFFDTVTVTCIKCGNTKTRKVPINEDGLWRCLCACGNYTEVSCSKAANAKPVAPIRCL